MTNKILFLVLFIIILVAVYSCSVRPVFSQEAGRITKDIVRGMVLEAELEKEPVITVCKDVEIAEQHQHCLETLCPEDEGGYYCWTDDERMMYAVCMGGKQWK